MANWGASSTAGGADTPLQWQYVTASGTASSSRLYIYMTSSGEVHLDNVKLVEGNIADAGANLLPDGDFESGFPGPWNVSPNLAASALNSATRHAGQSSLHIVSANAGTSQSTAIWQDIGPLVTDAPYTLSYWYLPNTNGSALTIRLSGSGINSVQNVAPAQTLALLSTPGGPNSNRAKGPAIPAVWINELESNNLNGLVDNAGEHDPWVELFNAGARAGRLDWVVLNRSV